MSDEPTARGARSTRTTDAATTTPYALTEPRGHAPYVRAEWLEETVWADPEYGRHSPVHGTLLSWVAQALPAGNSNSFRDSRFISEE